MNLALVVVAVLGAATGWLLAVRAASAIGSFLAGSYDLNDVWEDEEL